MRFKQFLLQESNVNDLSRKAFAETKGLFEKEIQASLKKWATGDVFEDDITLDEYLNTHVKRKFGILVEKTLRKLEGLYEEMALEEIEKRFGKMTHYGDLDGSGSDEENWKKLWWVGHIKVLIEDDSSVSDRQCKGYFLNKSSSVEKMFHARKWVGFDPMKEGMVGIQIAFNFRDFTRDLQEITTDWLLNSYNFKVELDNWHGVETKIISNIVDTYCHEVTHLIQHIKATLDSRARNVANDDNYAKKHFLDKKTLKKVEEIMTIDSKKWSDAQWDKYLSQAIEIDAHAVSVASKVLSAVASKNPETELTLIREIIDEIKFGYYDSKSMKMYQERFQGKDNKRFKIVWKRFLKKVSVQLLDRVDELKAEIKKQEDEYKKLEW